MKTTLFKNTFVVTAAIFMSMYAIPMYAQQEGLTNDKILSVCSKSTNSSAKDEARPCNPNGVVIKGETGAWWGYFSTDMTRNAAGLTNGVANEVYDAACLLKPDAGSQLIGKNVSAVKFYLRDLSCIDDIKIWLSKELPAKASDADIMVETLDKSTLVGGDDDNQHLGKENIYTIKNPYTVTEDGLYVGISLKVTNISEQAGQYSITNGETNTKIANSFLLKTSSVVTQWTDVNEMGLGVLAIQLLLSNGETTGIEGIDADVPASSRGIYTIGGARINGNADDLPKGVYIIDGKKVVK
ncbi:hypothetical protein [Prevotella sp. OH937_COT-195]|uniref:hypothetical protein n=1 Tax=Prevotella sp. OH937_COT-195 TaxID=2491051 RepID=UPI000F64EFD7|nr:hypothetical protein [Prevotella sp. OH937_COT-195]RRC99828.1 hypothetical protein EII32_07645 [Prevotella sp. OH937_COT-195]